MDWTTVLGVLKYLFMVVFLVIFVVSAVSKKSYKVYLYSSLTLAIVCLVLSQSWSIGIKIGAVVMVVLLTVKTLVDEKKRGSYMHDDKLEV